MFGVARHQHPAVGCRNRSLQGFGKGAAKSRHLSNVRAGNLFDDISSCGGTGRGGPKAAGVGFSRVRAETSLDHRRIHVFPGVCGFHYGEVGQFRGNTIAKLQRDMCFPAVQRKSAVLIFDACASEYAVFNCSKHVGFTGPVTGSHFLPFTSTG